MLFLGKQCFFCQKQIWQFHYQLYTRSICQHCHLQLHTVYRSSAHPSIICSWYRGSDTFPCHLRFAQNITGNRITLISIIPSFLMCSFLTGQALLMSCNSVGADKTGKLLVYSVIWEVKWPVMLWSGLHITACFFLMFFRHEILAIYIPVAYLLSVRG